MKSIITICILASVLMAQTPVSDSVAIYNIRTMMGRSGAELRSASNRLFGAIVVSSFGFGFSFLLMGANVWTDTAEEYIGPGIIIGANIGALVLTFLAWHDIHQAGKALTTPERLPRSERPLIPFFPGDGK